MAMVELLVGILVLSFGIIPIYHIFTASRRTVFRSEVSYMALHAARERLEELQGLPATKLAAMVGEGQWTAVTGHAFSRLMAETEGQPDPLQGDPVAGASALPVSDFSDPIFAYGPDYARIKLRVSVEQVRRIPPYLFKASVRVRWQEMGESVEKAEQENEKSFMSKLDAVICPGGFGEGDPR